MERGDGTRPGASDGSDPSFRSQTGTRKETTLIVEQGDGTRPGASDGDDPRQVPEGDVMGNQDALKRDEGLGVALKELRMRLYTTRRVVDEGG